MPETRANPCAAGTPDSGTGITMSAAAGAWRASSSPMRWRAGGPPRPGGRGSCAAGVTKPIERVLQVATVGARLGAVLARHQLTDELAVGGEHAGQHAEALRERGRVGEVAVVPEREAGVGHRAVHRLGVAPGARTGGRVPHVP